MTMFFFGTRPHATIMYRQVVSMHGACMAGYQSAILQWEPIYVS